MTRRQAWVAIATVLGALLLVQPASAAVGERMLAALEKGTDARSQWRDYSSRHAPDVLFVGDSRVTSDVETSLLSGLTGMRVAKFGIAGERSPLFDALIGRVLARADRPRLIVYALSEYQFNASYQVDPTPDLWQITAPVETQFIADALRVDHERERLVRGWTLPVFANYRIVARGLRCEVLRLRNDSGCIAPPPDPDQPDSRSRATITTQIRNTVLGSYSQVFLASFRYSDDEVAAVQRMASKIRRSGIGLAFAVLPQLGIENLDPVAYSRFKAGWANLGQVADFHDEFSDREELWADPAHLNSRGAAELAPALAGLIVSSSNITASWHGKPLTAEAWQPSSGAIGSGG